MVRTSSLFGLVAALTLGCTYATAAPWIGPLRSTRKERMTATTDPRDGVVRVATGLGICTGTLVDPRLVLTTHRCLSRIEIGEGTTFDFGALNAGVGGGWTPWRYARVEAMLSARETEVVALVLVDPVEDVPLMRLRLSAPPLVNEPARTIGFGVCSSKDDLFAGRSTGFLGVVTAVEPHAIAFTAAGCVGDTGGPLVSEVTGEVLGIVVDDPVHHDAPNASTSSAVQIARVDDLRDLLARAWLYSKGAR